MGSVGADEPALAFWCPPSPFSDNNDLSFIVALSLAKSRKSSPGEVHRTVGMPEDAEAAGGAWLA